MRALLAAALPLTVLIVSPASAEDLRKANFTAALFGNNAAAQDPLRDPFFPGQTFTGSFVFDNDLIPAPGPTAVNVFLPSTIPAADAFTLNFGPYVFTRADDAAVMVQYSKTRQFNGFSFNTNFVFEGATYVFSMNGGTFQVGSLANPFSPLLSGYVNIGNANLTGVTSYSPNNTAVPEPATWALMILGFGAIGAAMRRRVRTVVRYV